MQTPFSGGCLCGNIRYECSAAPIVMVNCHCRDCQKTTGTAYAAAMLVPRNAVAIAGDVKYYDVTGDSGGTVSRGFCPNCGSRLFSKRQIPELMGIMAGSLDDPSWFEPTVDVYADSAQPWDCMNPDLPKFDQMPPPKNSNVAD